jgi:hypothetical protein
MTTKTQHLIIDFGEQGHPLGRAIREEEVPGLIEALRRRLGCTAEELDLSPESLKRLESKLIALHQAVEMGHVQLGEENTVRLIREVAAYLGQVTIVNLGGQWEERVRTLWASTVDIPLPVETIKGKEISISPIRGFPPAYTAAYFWDLIGIGEGKGLLWKQYKRMTQKRWRETTKGLEEAIALQERLSK